MLIELFDLKLNKLRAVRYVLQPEENNPQTVVERFVHHVNMIAAEEHIERDKILGIGVGVPGIVELAKEETISAPAWGWVPVPLKTMLAEHIPLPLHVDNGSKLMALAEVQKNPAAHYEAMAVLNIATGVGAGVGYEGKR